jgi:hypothetical protein
MNKYAAALLVLLSLGPNLHAACPVGIYVIRDQGALNQFPTLYPQCEELDGLSARSATATNFSPLKDIKKIKGDAIFMESFHFKAFSGMSSLKEIGGTFRVDDADSIIDFAGLETLERIGGDFIIEANDQLIDLDGLFMLKEIGGKLEITNNTVLKTLFNTTSVQYLGTTPNSDLYVYKNPVLEDLNGLQSINQVKGKLTVESNKFLRNIDGLSGIASVDSAIRIASNDSLENTNGLRNIATCGDKIEIGSNKALKSINLQKLESARKRIGILANSELRSITGMNSMLKFDGDIFIKNNVKLDTIRALNGLREAGTLLDIGNNGPLPDYGFLRSLNKVAGSFHTSHTPLTFVGLDSLTHVGADFFLGTQAQSLAGLEKLEYVGRKLHIGGDSLKSLAALARLDTVRELTVTYCQKLTSLSGIDNIEVGSLGQVVVSYNPQLSHCAVKSMCDHLDRGGPFFAGVNKGNCADTAAIRKSCKDPTGISAPVKVIHGLQAYAIPAANGIEVRYRLAEESRVGIRVYDCRGNSIATLRIESDPAGERKVLVPIGKSRNGVFLVEVLAGSGKSIRKVLL